MPRGPAPMWRARKQPVVDDWIMASITRAGGIGHYDPNTGAYAELVIRGLADREEAGEWSRALYRCAHYMHRNGIAEVSMSAKIQRDGKQYKITFRAVDKVWARKHVLEKYGPDRSKWPYSPRGSMAQ